MVRNISWEETKLLEEYWNEWGFELCKPFRDATKKEKIAVYQSFGFQKHVLAMSIQELKKTMHAEIYRSFPEWLRNLFKDNVKEGDDGN